MYNIGTVTTTANSNKVTGTNTKWKENLNGVQPQQVIQIIVNDTVHNNSIASIESNTAMTLNFPFPVAAKDAKYVILTTMVDSVGAAANYMVALNNSNMQARDVANIWMTQTGTVPMTAPDGTKVNLRTAKEMDKLLDGKQAAGNYASGERFKTGTSNVALSPLDGALGLIFQKDGSLFTWDGSTSVFAVSPQGVLDKGSVPYGRLTGVTTDNNGFVKKASPIVKVFADHIETNEESEGVEMEHLGVGHYLIKGVVGFNADGAWGINNGFV
ncbi:hypothetical protein ABN062_22305, partial [Providencia manganoxydans]